MNRSKAISMIMIEFECDKLKANHILNFLEFDIGMVYIVHGWEKEDE